MKLKAFFAVFSILCAIQISAATVSVSEADGFAVSSCGEIPTDLAGNKRSVRGAPDLGCYEFGSGFTVIWF